MRRPEAGAVYLSPRQSVDLTRLTVSYRNPHKPMVFPEIDLLANQKTSHVRRFHLIDSHKPMVFPEIDLSANQSAPNIKANDSAVLAKMVGL